MCLPFVNFSVLPSNTKTTAEAVTADWIVGGFAANGINMFWDILQHKTRRAINNSSLATLTFKLRGKFSKTGQNFRLSTVRVPNRSLEMWRTLGKHEIPTHQHRQFGVFHHGKPEVLTSFYKFLYQSKNTLINT
ncbi:hypothetical protein [Adlercreutzia sp. ZJ154]|uniref:hypothetical protein n=1 Tax=Adlercreutzia sp. ZJ154 TaxID=2709790 RepID=UPI0013ED0E35|nr:hypothetical protein [Adlercreutzia sp. ZJ154]